MNEHQAIDRIEEIKHNVGDPNPWMALYVGALFRFTRRRKPISSSTYRHGPGNF